MREKLMFLQNELLDLWKTAKEKDIEKSKIMFKSAISAVTEILKLSREKLISLKNFDKMNIALVEIRNYAKIGLRGLAKENIEVKKKYRELYAVIIKLKKEIKSEKNKEKERQRTAV